MRPLPFTPADQPGRRLVDVPGRHFQDRLLVLSRGPAVPLPPEVPRSETAAAAPPCRPPAILFLHMSALRSVLMGLFVLPWFVLLGSRSERGERLGRICSEIGLASYAVYALSVSIYRLSYGAALLVGADVGGYAPWSGIVLLPPLVVSAALVTRLYDASAQTSQNAALSSAAQSRSG